MKMRLQEQEIEKMRLQFGPLTVLFNGHGLSSVWYVMSTVLVIILVFH